MTIGQKLSPVLSEIEDTLWEYEANGGLRPEFTMDGFRAATKIFMAAMMDKMWELQSKENMPMDDRTEMAGKCGDTLRKLIKTYTNLDSYTFYDNPTPAS